MQASGCTSQAGKPLGKIHKADANRRTEIVDASKPAAAREVESRVPLVVDLPKHVRITQRPAHNAREWTGEPHSKAMQRDARRIVSGNGRDEQSAITPSEQLCASSKEAASGEQAAHWRKSDWFAVSIVRSSDRGISLRSHSNESQRKEKK